MDKKYLTLIITAALAAVSATAGASGYRFGSQSVSSQGTAEANGAEAADASTIFANPAGLSRLEGRQIMGGVTGLVPHSTYADSGSTRFTGTSTGGQKLQDEYAPKAVAAPSLYYSHKINDQLTAGFGMFVPYGANLSYDWDWAGRYALTDMKLTAISLNPSVAWKINERHSIGFGLTAEFMKATLGQMVDVPGSVAAARGNPATAAQLLGAIVAAGGNPAALAAIRDARAEVEGKDWGYGFNVGYLYQPAPGTRFGIAYRSHIDHKLGGGADWDFSSVTTDRVINAIIENRSHHEDSAARVKLRTPETVSVNGYHEFDARLAGMFDVTWTRNSRMQNINIEFLGTDNGDLVIRQQWKNTVRVALGANYKLNDKVMLRAGIAHDEAPVRSDALRHAALPDSDRNQLSFGFNWKLTPKSSLDVAYSYLDFKKANGAYKNDCRPGVLECTGNGETTRGTWQTHMNLLGVAYNYQF
ncbi:outer membrane protein transport protein [Massilia sp. METH4]|uniref:OmpP1/FadL family transporter n=1 Tax=Massilia sp. METH4 TaxID=3123041 RepID=UPI0030D62CCB